MNANGIKEVYFGFTGRVKAGNQNRRGAVTKAMAHIEILDEIDAKITLKQMEAVRIGNVIRRRKREVTE